MKLRNWIGCAAVCVLLAGLPAEAQTTTRVSVDSLGVQVGGASGTAAVCADGSVVAFHSYASDLVANDTNNVADVFIRDLAAGTTTRVSVTSAGLQTLNGDSLDPAISPDGRSVAFHSIASNLPGANLAWQVYVHDLDTGSTALVSKDALGNPGDLTSAWASLSGSGRVAFYSSATNLLPGVTNGVADVYMHDLGTGATTRVSVDSNGLQSNGPSGSFFGAVISADGEHVVFSSQAKNLVTGTNPNNLFHVYVHDLPTGTTVLVSKDSAGTWAQMDSGYPSISADGRCAAFISWAAIDAGDQNQVADVYVHDRDADGNGVFDEVGGISTELASLHTDGTQGDDHSGLALERGPAISADANAVAFYSKATNLVDFDTNGRWDVFLHNRTTRETSRVSLSTAGVEGDKWSRHPSISQNGRFIAFESNATNLAPGITNNVTDAFLRDQGVAPPVAYCTPGTTSSGCAARISSLGTPSASAASGFDLLATGAEGNKSGLFFFGTSGRQANPWGNGTSFQCVTPPVKRAGLLTGTGNAGQCDGSFSQDLNQLWFSFPAKNPGAGAVVQAQLWFRDPLNTSNQSTSLSDAIEFVMSP